MHASTFYFGKLPAHGDFVRFAPNGTAVGAVDDWLQKALYRASARPVDGFEAAYETAPACSFYLRLPGHPRPLAGVLQPSHDRIGRKFPFLIGLDAPENNHEAATWPVRHAAFVEQATALVQAATAQGLTHTEVQARLDDLPADAPDAGALAAFDRYLAETPARMFWTRLFGAFDDPRKYVLVRNLNDFLTPYRGHVPPNLGFGFRLPLCADGLTVAYDASLWLMLCLRILADPEAKPSFFWQGPASSATPADVPPAAEAPSAFVLLFLNTPPAETLLHVLPLNHTSDRVCELDRIGLDGPDEAAEALPPAQRTVLDDPSCSIRDLLNAW